MKQVYFASCLIFVWVLIAGISCSTATNPGSNSTSGGDADVDAGGDTDSDTDSDTDADTDTVYVYDGPPIPETCADAILALTSVGCEFFLADLDRYDGEDPRPYSAVVSNPHLSQVVEIVVEHGTLGELQTFTLDPLALQVIPLACDSGCLAPPQEVNLQGIGTGSAFRISSDFPVLAYQWNPYGTIMASADASLLLPKESLDTNYIAATWGFGPGGSVHHSQITVVATEDNTEVRLVPSTAIPAFGGLGPYASGVQTPAIALDAFDVLTVYPDAYDADLTGTAIEASNPVVVFGCHTCAQVPDGSFAACDHLEEQQLPLSAWGSKAVLAKHDHDPDCLTKLTVWRVVAGVDDMTVEFDPPAPAPAGASYSFAQQGQILTFESSEDHYVSGTLNNPPDPLAPEASFLAYQLMAGTTYTDCPNSLGDPMLLLVPPAGQYLDRYVFNTDDQFNFAYDHIIVVRPAGAEVNLDCLGPIPDGEFSPVGSTSWEVARIYVDDPSGTNPCTDGAHVLAADQPVGLSVVGAGNSSSYGYPGGLGLRPINPKPIIE